MSKELVISSNRHETRVGILEEDQLVEIYFQRSNEYSLAGSVHKGRVTRVLPGMQSAFVDLGLERDTFLYVSDFFEDHSEEYDKVTGGAEERPAPRENRGDRGERGGRNRDRGGNRHDRHQQQQPAQMQPRTVEDQPQHVEAGEPGGEESVPQALAQVDGPVVDGTVTSASAPAEGGPRPPRDRNQDDRRGGRRGRRRRGRGRGFPESKYAADVPPPGGVGATGPAEAADVEEFEPEEVAGPEIVEEDVFVLPGESIAKYRHATAVVHTQPEPEAELEADEEEDEEEEVEVAEVATIVAAPVETIITTEDPAEHPSANAIPDAPVHPERIHTMAEEVPVHVEPVHPPVVHSPVVHHEHVAHEHVAYEGTGFEIPETVTVIHASHEVELAPVVEHEEEEELEAPHQRLQILDDEEDREIQEMIFHAEADADAAHEAALSGEMEGFTASLMQGHHEEPEVTEGEASVTGAPQEARLRDSGGGRYGQRQGGRRMRRGRDRDRRGGGGGGGPRPAVEGVAPVAAAAPVSAAPVHMPVVPIPHRTPAGGPMPSISDLLKEGQEIIVQIAKEPLGQKGARITSHIALPGRFVVYMPTLDHMGVSRKIASDEERHRLKKILQNARAGITGGCIIRTAGEGKSEEEITADITFLYNLWLDMRQKAEKRPAPMLLHHDLDIVQRILRDQFNESFKAIWVDNEEMYESVVRFVERFQPALIGKVKLYTRPVPIFDAFNVTAELEKALRPKVWLKSGGYIVINQTEALVAIDINTGKFVGKSNRLEDTIVKTNIEAVKEIVRQIRLRDLGGIIVIDFIDMDERKNRAKVMQALEEAMRQDRAPYKILQFNDFGLVAITRKRVKQSLERALCAPCPYCEGAGSVKSVQTVLGEILQEAQKIAPAVEGSNVMLRCHPEVAKVLKSHHNQYLEELEEILKRPILVKSDPAIHQEKFDLA